MALTVFMVEVSFLSLSFSLLDWELIVNELKN